MWPHDKVALEDREGRRFEDKGSCQHVPWQAIDQKFTPYPSKSEEPQNVYWKFPASCLLEKCTRRKDREQSSGLNSVRVCWILLLGALANGMFLHSHNRVGSWYDLAMIRIRSCVLIFSINKKHDLVNRYYDT